MALSGSYQSVHAEGGGGVVSRDGGMGLKRKCARALGSLEGAKCIFWGVGGEEERRGERGSRSARCAVLTWT